MTTLLNATITGALTGSPGSVFQTKRRQVKNILVQANFTYGSGGTTVDAYLQTSLDGGASWIDIANFHFTTSSAKALFNLSSATPISTQYTPTDGSLAQNTCKDGIVGDRFRMKTTTTGTYAGATTLVVDVTVQDALTPMVQ